MSFYSNSGSGEQKPHKREPREEISRKLIVWVFLLVFNEHLYSEKCLPEYLN